MKTLLYFSMAALILILLCKGITSQVVSVPNDHKSYVINRGRALIAQGRVAGDMKNWLSVETYNGTEFYNNGFDPSYTRVVSNYKPMFRKLSTGQWEIMFTSEIAEKIP